MKITILYFSDTGNTEKMGHAIAEGIKQTGDIDVRMMNLKDEANIDVDFVNDSKAVIFGTPTYVASMCWQLKAWFDKDWNCKLAGKLGAVYATANAMHGGADVAIANVINHLLVKGMVVYSSGAGCGRPFIHLGPIALRDNMQEKEELFKLFGKRIAEKTTELFG